jgi:hypothetical protein
VKWASGHRDHPKAKTIPNKRDDLTGDHLLLVLLPFNLLEPSFNKAVYMLRQDIFRGTFSGVPSFEHTLLAEISEPVYPIVLNSNSILILVTAQYFPVLLCNTSSTI